jgi:hypothetical protein
MKRIVVLGPGGAGKSTFSKQLGARIAIPVVELDRVFWSDVLEPTSTTDWRARQVAMADEPAWIMDGDLGPYDVLEPRLRRADIIIILDMAPWRCIWRSIRWSRPRIDYWRWLLGWRWRSRPGLFQRIGAFAPSGSAIVTLTNPDAVDRWLAGAGRRRE